MRCARLIKAAAGRERADLLLRDARVVDVFGHRILRTDVAVLGDRIVGLGGGYQARRAVNLGGRYLAPGFIEGHLHLESSMLLPSEFARLAAPRGTALCVCDPHEIANVMGLAGIRLLARLSRRLPVEFRYGLPSCVPATSLETSGHRLTAVDLARLTAEPWVAGLGEVMNFPGLIAADPGLLAKLEVAAGKPRDGHAPGLSGQPLAAYLVCGIGSDHECTGLAEAEEKLSAGCHIMIREGSTARNLAALLPLVQPATLPRLMLVSDDLSPEELLGEGHLDRILRRARALGADPLSMIRMVTLNPALYFGLGRRGAVAPGYRADLCVLEDLEKFRPVATFAAGRQTSAEGEPLELAPAAGRVEPRNTMRLRALSADLFRLPFRAALGRIIELVPGQIVTRQAREPLRERDGLAVADPARDIVKLGVIERHGRSKGPNVGLGFLRGLGLARGGLASSVAHDSHNLIVAGVDEADMACAANALIGCGGGQAVAAGGKVLALLPLPVAGLLSLEGAPEVVRQEQELKRAARGLGSRLENPFMALSFLALPVIGDLKLTDLGLVDVGRFKIVPLWVNL